MGDKKQDESKTVTVWNKGKRTFQGVTGADGKLVDLVPDASMVMEENHGKAFCFDHPRELTTMGDALPSTESLKRREQSLRDREAALAEREKALLEKETAGSGKRGPGRPPKADSAEEAQA